MPEAKLIPRRGVKIFDFAKLTHGTATAQSKIEARHLSLPITSNPHLQVNARWFARREFHQGIHGLAFGQTEFGKIKDLTNSPPLTAWPMNGHGKGQP